MRPAECLSCGIILSTIRWGSKTEEDPSNDADFSSVFRFPLNHLWCWAGWHMPRACSFSQSSRSVCQQALEGVFCVFLPLFHLRSGSGFFAAAFWREPNELHMLDFVLVETVPEVKTALKRHTFRKYYDTLTRALMDNIAGWHCVLSVCWERIANVVRCASMAIATLGQKCQEFHSQRPETCCGGGMILDLAHQTPPLPLQWKPILSQLQLFPHPCGIFHNKLGCTDSFIKSLTTYLFTQVTYNATFAQIKRKLHLAERS